MLSPNPQQCPICTGAINRENSTVVHLLDRTVEAMLCEYCKIAWLVETYEDGEVFSLEFHERTEPACFEKFVEELEDARAA